MSAMLSVAHDLALGCAVLIQRPPCDDDGWRRYIQIIDELQTRVPASQRPVLVQVLRRGITSPSATVRREMAALRGRIRRDAVNAVVAEDQSIRLMQTALDWLRKPHYESSTHADFGAAVAQIERALGKPMPRLEALYREAARG